MFKKVLFPLTFCLDIERVIDTANFLSLLNIERFDLLNVISSGLCNIRSSESSLQKAANIIREKTSYDVSAGLIEGHAATKIVETAKEKDYDLIFIPAQEKNIMSRTILGSTSSDVIRMTDTPTLIYKNFSKEPINWEVVFYPTDFKEAAQRAKPYVKYMGQIASKLVIQHVGKRAADPSAEINRKMVINQKLNGLQEEFEAYWTEVKTVTELGSPSTEIRHAAEKNRSNLVIMGRGNTGVVKKLVGSTAERVANSVKSSVLLIP